MCSQSVYAVTVTEADWVWLSRILMDADRDEALEFVKTVVHRQIAGHKNGLLQSHLDAPSNPIAAFEKKRNET